MLTDLPLGFWTAATALDLRGRPEDRGASRWLVGAGLAASGPAALTGLAEWAPAGAEAQRVGALHGALNAAASGMYLTSFVARSRRRHTLGVVTALAGAALTGASGYLGGHLTTARKVGSRDRGVRRRHGRAAGRRWAPARGAGRTDRPARPARRPRRAHLTDPIELDAVPRLGAAPGPARRTLRTTWTRVLPGGGPGV